MASDKPPQNILPLESFSLTAAPSSTHNIVWSPDAELAIGCDDCVFVFVPEFSIPKTANGGSAGVVRQYNETTLRFPTVEHRSPELNRPIFDLVKQKVPDFEYTPGGGGSGTVASQGSSMNHLVALEWSPSGLGRMNRSVLAILTGSGSITIYCEGASDGMNAFKLRGRNARALSPWVAAWGVGAGMLLPLAKGHEVDYTKEYITSFAWAKDTGSHGALLAYANDDEEVVIISVQSKHNSSATPGDCGQWRVEEVARFVAEGPHPKVDPTDPDYSPSGSSYALSWGPWMKRGRSKTSIISYVAKNYVGFRQVTIHLPYEHMTCPKVEVGKVDSNGVCHYLSTDAFVVWEDLIWTVGDLKVCRGIIATPSQAKAFQIQFDCQPSSRVIKHTTDECKTTYPDQENSVLTQNPITGLIIHPPSLSRTTGMPSYSLVRLSATHENDGWFQTNLPLPTNLEDGIVGPRWATEINQTIEHQLPRAMAYKPMADTGSAGSEDGSADEEEIDADSAEGSDYDPEENFAGLDTEDQVHINRVRIWGMTASPGGGITAVFTSHHSTVWYGRDTYAGVKCRVLFGRHDCNADQNKQKDTALAMKKLSTEAKVFEWMYGGGPPVTGLLGSTAEDNEEQAALKDHFAIIGRSQTCSFCGLPLEPMGKMSRCGNKHIFATCATTGLPILAPGMSRTCGVCGSKCLKREDLVVMAPQLRDIIMDEISAELCGGCGGKFIN